MKKNILFVVILFVVTKSFSQGNVGIGTNTPGAKLHVLANSGVGTPHIRVEETENDFSRLGFYNSGTAKFWDIAARSEATDANSVMNFYNSSTGNLMTIKGNGNVGIGTVSPVYKLDVSGRLRIQHSSGTAGIYFDGTTLPTRSFIGTYDDDHVALYGNGGAGWNFTMNVNNGNVGIGTTEPAYKLDVDGRLRLQHSTNTAGIYFDGITLPTRSFIGTYDDDHIGIYGSGGASWNLIMNVNNGNVGIGNTAPQFPLHFKNVVGGKISFWNDPATNFGIGLQHNLLQMYTAGSFADIAFGHGRSDSLTETMRIKGNGNVGIGTANPAYKLDVSGRLRLQHSSGTAGIYFDGTTLPTRSFIGTLDDNHMGLFGAGVGWNLIMNVNNGNVGIGNTAPQFPLQFKNVVGGKISFWNDPVTNFGIGLQNNLLQMYTVGSFADIAFGHGRSDSLTETMRIKGNGNVGIGTTNPSGKFHIAGNSATGFPLIKAEESENDFSRIGYYNAGSNKFWETAAISEATDANSSFNIYNSSTGNLVTVKGNGNMGVGTTAPGAKLDVNGFTKLGSNAPAIKMKKITGTIDNIGSQLDILHGVNATKILGVTALVVTDPATGAAIPPGNGAGWLYPGYEYYINVTSVFIRVTVNISNSSQLLGKTIKLVVTYEE